MGKVKSQSLLSLVFLALLPLPILAQDYNAEFIDRFFVVPKVEESSLVFGSATERNLNAESIKFLVWNIYRSKRNDFHEDFALLAKETDIMMLQEANSQKLLPFYEQTQVQWGFGISYHLALNHEQFTGTLLGGRAKAIDFQVTKSVDVEPITFTPKTLTSAKFEIEGSFEQLLVINIHALNFVTQGAFERHIAQALALIDEHQGPIVFAGDFNTHTRRRMDFMRQTLVESYGFEELNFENDERMRAYITGHILDHAFVRGLEVVGSEVVGAIHSSDHKPILFEVRLKNQTLCSVIRSGL